MEAVVSFFNPRGLKAFLVVLGASNCTAESDVFTAFGQSQALRGGCCP
jgi:hypothetical protein